MINPLFLTLVIITKQVASTDNINKAASDIQFLCILKLFRPDLIIIIDVEANQLITS